MDYKIGLTKADIETIINSEATKNLKEIKTAGLMGMATNSTDKNQVKDCKLP